MANLTQVSMIRDRIWKGWIFLTTRVIERVGNKNLAQGSEGEANWEKEQRIGKAQRDFLRQS